MAKIHPLAHVDPNAELHDNVEVGPFCYVGAGVVLGARTVLMNNVSVHGPTRIGEDNVFFPFCSIGADPQDLSFHGEDSRTEIGDRNRFRENCTVHRGTAKDELLTRVGNDNLIMACSHIAHDCMIDDHVVMANNVLLGGHVHVESFVTFGGSAVVHQFATVGELAFVGGMTGVRKDLPPYMTLEGTPAKVWMVNKVGCMRRGVSAHGISQLKEAHRLLYRSDMSWEEVFELLEERDDQTPEIRTLLAFCRRIESGHKGRAREARRKPVPVAG